VTRTKPLQVHYYPGIPVACQTCDFIRSPRFGAAAISGWEMRKYWPLAMKVSFAWPTLMR